MFATVVTVCDCADKPILVVLAFLCRVREGHTHQGFAEDLWRTVSGHPQHNVLTSNQITHRD